MKRGVHRIWWLRVFLIDVKWKGMFKKQTGRAVVGCDRAVDVKYERLRNMIERFSTFIERFPSIIERVRMNYERVDEWAEFRLKKT